MSLQEKRITLTRWIDFISNIITTILIQKDIQYIKFQKRQISLEIGKYVRPNKKQD